MTLINKIKTLFDSGWDHDPIATGKLLSPAETFRGKVVPKILSWTLGIVGVTGGMAVMGPLPVLSLLGMMAGTSVLSVEMMLRMRRAFPGQTFDPEKPEDRERLRQTDDPFSRGRAARVANLLCSLSPGKGKAPLLSLDMSPNRAYMASHTSGAPVARLSGRKSGGICLGSWPWMSPASQLEGTLAHEAGHHKLSHTMHMARAVLPGVFGAVEGQRALGGLGAPLAGMAFMGAGLLLANILFSAQSRCHEREADRFAAVNGFGAGLADSLFYNAHKGKPPRQTLRAAWARLGQTHPEPSLRAAHLRTISARHTEHCATTRARILGL